jgi:hypothetical protein
MMIEVPTMPPTPDSEIDNPSLRSPNSGEDTMDITADTAEDGTNDPDISRPVGYKKLIIASELMNEWIREDKLLRSQLDRQRRRMDAMNTYLQTLKTENNKLRHKLDLETALTKSREELEVVRKREAREENETLRLRCEKAELEAKIARQCQHEAEERIKLSEVKLKEKESLAQALLKSRQQELGLFEQMAGSK